MRERGVLERCCRDVGEAEVKLSSATGGVFDDVNPLNLTFVPTLKCSDSSNMSFNIPHKATYKSSSDVSATSSIGHHVLCHARLA